MLDTHLISKIEKQTQIQHGNPTRQCVYFSCLSVYKRNGGWNNFDMILIDRCSCVDGLDAKKKERELIEALGANLNKSIPSRARTEYWQEYGSKQEYKEKRKLYMTDYRATHATELHEKVQCGCGGRYPSSYKAAHLKCAKHLTFLESLNAYY